MTAQHDYHPSRFTLVTERDESVILYNSLRGTLSRVRPPHSRVVHQLLHNRNAVISGPFDPGTQDVVDSLVERGHLVPGDQDERDQARALRDERLNREDRLELILMPTESCNFRCPYCYEDFKLARMRGEVREGIRRLVDAKAEEGLRSLSVVWFGGEPLVAFDVVEELSSHFSELAERTGIAYDAAMTTNGYLLTDETADRCIELGVRKYQITLDGPRHVHDKSRPLMGSGGTFDQIMEGVRGLARRPGDDFKAELRVNFTEDNAGSVPELLDELAELAAHDPRFRLMFRAVGHWGGPADEDVSICSGKDGELTKLGFYESAVERGLHADDVVNTLQPGKQVCYAANPWSLLVRPDGTLGKCTVALRDDRNKVGRLHGDGRLELDGALMDLWTRNDEETDSTCQECFYRPSCQGAYCPLIRIQDGKRPCPSQKVWIGSHIDLAATLRQPAGGARV